MLLESLQAGALIPLLSLGAEHKASKVHSPFAGFLCSCQARQQHTHNPSRAYYNCYYNKVLFTKVSINRTSCQTKKKRQEKIQAFASGTVSHVSLPILVIFLCCFHLAVFQRNVSDHKTGSYTKKVSKCITSNQN